jgi:hypothetical protein
MTLAPLRVARGLAAPASATAQPLARLGAACAGGWPFLAPPSSRHTSWSGSTAGLRVELARPDSLRGRDFARLRLGRCPRRPRGPVPFGPDSLRGRDGPREDRRGSSRRSAALFRPAGFGWGRALGCGTRQLAASPTPPPIRARAKPSLTRVVQNRLTAVFHRRLSVRAFQDHFSGSFGRFGG